MAAQIPSGVFLWPWLVAATASEAAAALVGQVAGFAARADEAPAPPAPPRFASRHRIACELPTMRLRDFSTASDGPATLVCAPYTLHGATIVDFAPGHSLVAALRAAGLARLYVTDWRSATPQMRDFTIDHCLADLNVAVDDAGAPVDLVGLCQGGWLALAYAARFPGKVRRLVLAGAPVDIAAGESGLSRLAASVPLSVFRELVALGEGRVLGRKALDLWGPKTPTDEAVRTVLQIDAAETSGKVRALHQRFRDWYAWTVDLPGAYYLEVVEWLYKQNRLAEGKFVALGRRIDLGAVTQPIYLLAARDDELVAQQQLFATARRIGTPAHAVRRMVAPCPHLGLFLGRGILTTIWPAIGRWLGEDDAVRLRA